MAEKAAFLKEVLRYTADSSLVITLLVGLLLVLKHTTGPDHLAAVTTLIAYRESGGDPEAYNPSGE